MALKHFVGVLAITGAILSTTGCPKQEGAAAGGSTAASGSAAASGAAAPAAGMDDDAKHKLYQAAAMTGDSNLVMEVNKKIGIMKADGMPTDDMNKFVSGHGEWAQKNVTFIQEMGQAGKAKEYVDKNK